MLNSNPAEMEFGEEQEKPEVKEPEVPVATKAELDSVRSELNTKLQEIDSLKSKTAIVDKLQELFTGKPEDPKDAYVRNEIKRLVPELDDLDKIKRLLPEILVTLQGAAEEQTVVKASEAQDIMRGLMDGVGLDGKDDEAVSYLEEACVREIKGNRELYALWMRGNVKSAVNKAFDKVQSKLIAPVRARMKRDAVRTITDAPKASPRGGAPTPVPSAKTKVDFSDTSRDGAKKIHDAAFERLQELLDRD